MQKLLTTVLGISVVAFALTPAYARDEIRVGVTGTFTGPAASIGIPYQQAARLFPNEIGGRQVEWVVLDDGGDPNAAVRNARRFTEDLEVDAILGSTSPPGSMAIFDVAIESGTPQLSLAPVGIPDDRRTWLFSVPQPVPVMVSAVVEHMVANSIARVAYIGFTDSWGDQNYNALLQEAERAGIEVLTNERYNRTDTSVTAQTLRMLGSNPDAVFIGASGTPAVLPNIELRDRGFTGQIYNSHGSISPFVLRAGGAAMEGSVAPTGPIVVTEDLPDDYPTRQPALDFLTIYEGEYGPDSRNPFAGYAWDAMLILSAAIPAALEMSEPGTPEFREALRAQIESGREVAGTHAIYKYTENDHFGVDERSRVLVIVNGGRYEYLPN